MNPKTDPFAAQPGCIRRELLKMQAEDNIIGYSYADSETQIAVAFHRWAKKQTNEKLCDAILIIVNHVIRDKSCLQALLMEAIRRLKTQSEKPIKPKNRRRDAWRSNAELSDAGGQSASASPKDVARPHSLQ